MRIAGFSNWIDRRAMKRQMSDDLHKHLAPAIAAIRSEEGVLAERSRIFLIVDDVRRQRIRWAWGFVLTMSAGALAYYTYGIYW